MNGWKRALAQAVCVAVGVAWAAQVRAEDPGQPAGKVAFGVERVRPPHDVPSLPLRSAAPAALVYDAYVMYDPQYLPDSYWAEYPAGAPVVHCIAFRVTRDTPVTVTWNIYNLSGGAPIEVQSDFEGQVFEAGTWYCAHATFPEGVHPGLNYLHGRVLPTGAPSPAWPGLSQETCKYLVQGSAP